MSRSKRTNTEAVDSEITVNEAATSPTNDVEAAVGAVPSIATAGTSDAPLAAREPGDEQERSYPPEPNPRPWAIHKQAGVELRTHRDPYEAELVFQDKPSQPVIDCLKESGFRWNRHEKAWTRPVNYDTQAQDRLIASRAYHKVVNMILEEKGLVAEPEKTPF